MSDFGLSLDPWGKLVLIDAEGVRHVGVTPVRVFPTSDAEHWISIVNTKGEEVALVPDPKALAQPVRELLENAFRHGVERQIGAVTITVSATLQSGRLRLCVEDTAGQIDGPLQPGVGLGNLQQRLQALHGDAAQLTLSGVPGGGAVATLELPCAC